MYSSTYMTSYLKESNSQKQKVEVVTRGWRGEGYVSSFLGTELQSCKMENVCRFVLQQNECICHYGTVHLTMVKMASCMLYVFYLPILPQCKEKWRREKEMVTEQIVSLDCTWGICRFVNMLYSTNKYNSSKNNKNNCHFRNIASSIDAGIG